MSTDVELFWDLLKHYTLCYVADHQLERSQFAALYLSGVLTEAKRAMVLKKLMLPSVALQSHDTLLLCSCYCSL